MLAVRLKFEKDLIRFTGQAMGVHKTLEYGREVLRKRVADSPSLPVVVGIFDDPRRIKRMVGYFQTNKQVLSLLDDNPNLIFEPFLGSVIQLWNDFLCDIFYDAVRESLRSPGVYTLKKLEIRLENFANIDEANLANSVAESARKRFDDTSVKEKIQAVAKVLSVNLGSLTDEIKRITENIVVRNALQHNHGFLRQRDLDEVGSSYIPFDQGEEIIQLGLGDRAYRSAYDIDELAEAMGKVSRMLVP